MYRAGNSGGAAAEGALLALGIEEKEEKEENAVER
jgi:hypothetical protein